MPPFLSPDPKPDTHLNKTKIQKKLRDGRGQGAGATYRPFLEVRDVPSSGRVHRRPSITHGRVVHLLSDLELAAFLFADWQPNVIDIREQFPLDPEKTIELSEAYGIPHPAYRGVNQVMTTDLVIDIRNEAGVSSHAISVKYAKDLEDRRKIEKLELERRYWAAKNVPWSIFTENEVPKKMLANIKWLLPHFNSFELQTDQLSKVFSTVAGAINLGGKHKLPEVMSSLDQNKKAKPGTHLLYLRHLLAQRALVWDMNNISYRSLHCHQIQPSEYWLKGDYRYVSA